MRRKRTLKELNVLNKKKIRSNKNFNYQAKRRKDRRKVCVYRF